jgi:putative transposase
MQRREIIANDEFYHVFNRGVEKRIIFTNDKDYKRFLNNMANFNTDLPSWKLKFEKFEDGPRINETGEKLVDIVAYCINPNHFHLILRQIKDDGITTFMKKISTGYAMYFNKKYDHSGVLFQGRFKSVHISSDSQLLHVSAYVNCNCEIHGIAQAKNYPWSSFEQYIGRKNNIVKCETEPILSQFKNYNEYKNYAMDKAKEIRDKKEREDSFLE